MATNDHIKHAVLSKLLAGGAWQSSGRAKFKAGGRIIHIRFCSSNGADNSKYKFNINPNTLSADYEVWICGDINTYYVIPRDVIHQMYTDSESYVDRMHPEIRVVSVDTNADTATYARGGKNVDLKPYYSTTL